MQIKRIVMCTLALLLAGCNSQEIKPELADRSGRFDGNLKFIFDNSNRIQSSGINQYTCPTGQFAKSFSVEGGKVWSGASGYRQVGIIDGEGNLFIRDPDGKYSVELGAKRQAYYLISGTLGSDRVIHTRMIYAYSESNSGCTYTAQGRLVPPEEKKQQQARPQQRLVDVIWGYNTYRGDFIYSGEFTAGNNVSVSFYSDADSLSCRGILKLKHERSGDWSLNCGDGVTASGQYLHSDQYRSFIGKDQRGNAVSLLMSIK